MKLENIMSTRIVTVELDDTLDQVREIFDHVAFHHVLVIEDGELFGVLSDRDLFKAISPYIGTPAETSRDRETLTRKVHQVMSRHPLSLKPDASVADAIKLFNNNKISFIPIVDDKKQPIGVVSWRDIIRHVDPEQFEN